MGFIAETFRPLAAALTRRAESSVSPPGLGQAPLGGLANGGTNPYLTYARQGYGGNEIVYSAIELRATSAAEPRLVGRRRMTEPNRRRLRAALFAAGASRLAVDYELSNLDETVTDHPAVVLGNNPNPYMTRFQFWSSVIMHRDLAGNAYAWKGRSGGKDGEPDSLWLLRPDRVRIIPASAHTIRAYRYSIGSGAAIEFAPEDIVHFRNRHAYDDHYGMSPLMPLVGRLDLDNYMREFAAAFFRHGGNPGAILAIKQRLTQEAKDEIRERHRRQFGGPAGWFDLMVLDQAEASFSTTTMTLGQRGLVLPELNAITEARVAMAFGIPASILGLYVGMESSSYANKRQDWQVFWDITLAPLYSDLDDTLNLQVLPEFGGGLDELLFDLSQIRALQEDVDRIHDRWRKDLLAAGVSIEEFRSATGREPAPSDGTFLVPANLIPTPARSLGLPLAPADLAARTIWALGAVAAPAISIEASKGKVSEVRCPECDKLCARDLSEGEPAYCRKCKLDFKVGGS